jgi:hypothetical protein
VYSSVGREDASVSRGDLGQENFLTFSFLISRFSFVLFLSEDMSGGQQKIPLQPGLQETKKKKAAKRLQG